MATPLAATFLGLLLVHNLLPGACRWRSAEGVGTARSPQGPTGTTAPPAWPRPTARACSGASLAAAMPAAAAHGRGCDRPCGTDRPGAASPAREATAASTAAAATGSGRWRRLPPRRPSAGRRACWLARRCRSSQLTAATDATATATEEEVGPIGRYVRGDGSDGTIVLTDGDDIFVGGDGDEHVVGGAGDDYLDGAGGDDQLEGGAGDDTLSAAAATTSSTAVPGDDQLDGGTGDDRLLGGSRRRPAAGRRRRRLPERRLGHRPARGRDRQRDPGPGRRPRRGDRARPRHRRGRQRHGGRGRQLRRQPRRGPAPGTGGRATFVLGRADVGHLPAGRRRLPPADRSRHREHPPGGQPARTTSSATTGPA